MSSGLGTGSGVMQVKGIPELMDKLRALGAEKQVSTVLRAAVKAGAKVPRSEAAGQLAAMSSLQNPPKMHKTHKGNLAMPGYASRHIGIQTFVSKDKQAAKAIIGPTDEAYYASSFVELGVPHYGIAPRPWLAPALADNREYSVKQIGGAMRKKIEQIARKKKGVGK